MAWLRWKMLGDEREESARQGRGSARMCTHVVGVASAAADVAAGPRYRRSRCTPSRHHLSAFSTRAQISDALNVGANQ